MNDKTRNIIKWKGIETMEKLDRLDANIETLEAQIKQEYLKKLKNFNDELNKDPIDKKTFDTISKQYLSTYKEQIRNSEFALYVDIDQIIYIDGKSISMIDYIMENISFGNDLTFFFATMYLSAYDVFEKSGMKKIHYLYKQKDQITYKNYMALKKRDLIEEIKTNSALIQEAIDVLYSDKYEHLQKELMDQDYLTDDEDKQFEEYEKEFDHKKYDDSCFKKLKACLKVLEDDINYQNKVFITFINKCFYNCVTRNLENKEIISWQTNKPIKHIIFDDEDYNAITFDDRVKQFYETYHKQEIFFNLLFANYNEDNKIEKDAYFGSNFAVDNSVMKLPKKLSNVLVTKEEEKERCTSLNELYYQAIDTFNETQKKLEEAKTNSNTSEEEQNKIKADKDKQEETLIKLEDQRKNFCIDADKNVYKLYGFNNANRQVEAYKSLITYRNFKDFDIQFNTQYFKFINNNTYILIRFFFNYIAKEIANKSADHENADIVVKSLSFTIKPSNDKNIECINGIISNDENQTRAIEDMQKQLLLLRNSFVDIKKYADPIKEELKKEKENLLNLTYIANKNALEDKNIVTNKEKTNIKYQIKSCNDKIKALQSYNNYLAGFNRFPIITQFTPNDFIGEEYDENHNLKANKDNKKSRQDDGTITTFKVEFADEFSKFVKANAIKAFPLPPNYKKLSGKYYHLMPLVEHISYVEQIDLKCGNNKKIYKYAISNLLSYISTIPSAESDGAKHHLKERVYAPLIEILETLRQLNIIVYRLHPSIQKCYKPNKEIKTNDQVVETPLPKDFMDATIMIKILYSTDKKNINADQKLLNNRSF